MAHVHKIILEYTQLKLDKGKTKAQVGRKLDILERVRPCTSHPFSP